MPKKYKVIIAQKDTILRERLTALLNATDDLKVIGEFVDGLEAITCIKRKKPHLVLLDIGKARVGGIAVIKALARAVPATKILVLTIHRDEEFVRKSFLAGADGFCLKNTCQERLQHAIQTLLPGNTYISPEISKQILKAYPEHRGGLRTEASSDALA